MRGRNGSFVDLKVVSLRPRSGRGERMSRRIVLKVEGASVTSMSDGVAG